MPSAVEGISQQAGGNRPKTCPASDTLKYVHIWGRFLRSGRIRTFGGPPSARGAVHLPGSGTSACAPPSRFRRALRRAGATPRSRVTARKRPPKAADLRARRPRVPSRPAWHGPRGSRDAGIGLRATPVRPRVTCVASRGTQAAHALPHAARDAALGVPATARTSAARPGTRFGHAGFRGPLL